MTIDTFHTRITDGGRRQAITESLLAILEREEDPMVPAQTSEEDRMFTMPFSDYCFPLYDHIHNCIERLARDLPQTMKSREYRC
jgi:hypothetical protein